MCCSYSRCLYYWRAYRTQDDSNRCPLGKVVTDKLPAAIRVSPALVAAIPAWALHDDPDPHSRRSFFTATCKIDPQANQTDQHGFEPFKFRIRISTLRRRMVFFAALPPIWSGISESFLFLSSSKKRRASFIHLAAEAARLRRVSRK